MKIAPEITLTDEERATLDRWSRGRSTPVRLVLRSKIVMLAAAGKMNKEIARRLKTAPKTVSLWRRRFADQRLAGIEKDAPRGGRKPRARNKIARLSAFCGEVGRRGWAVPQSAGTRLGALCG